MSTTEIIAERRHARLTATQLNGRQRRHQQALIEAEAETPDSRGDTPRRASWDTWLSCAQPGAARWQTGQSDRALRVAVDQRRLEQLSSGYHRKAHGDPGAAEPRDVA